MEALFIIYCKLLRWLHITKPIYLTPQEIRRKDLTLEIIINNLINSIMKLIKNLSKDKNYFDASMLKIGELMETSEDGYEGEIIIRVYEKLVSLSNPSHIWSNNSSGQCVKLIGIKLSPGESITLIQE